MNGRSTRSQTAAAGGDALKRAAIRELAVLAAGVLVVLTIVVWLLGWIADSSATGEVAGRAVDPETRTITVTLPEEPPQLDSTQATDQVSYFVLGHVMEGLLRYDAHNRLAPGVAKSWDIEPDHAVFHLRADARWSDGKPVTAQDFVFAWRTAVDPATASQYAFILYPVKNAEAINTGKLPVTALGVQALDDRTLRVEFQRPIAYFDKLVAFPTYMPIRRDFYRSRHGHYAANAGDLLYDGPFEITTWVHGAHLRLDKNPYYWDRRRIRLNAIDIPYITTDSNAVLNLYKDGKVAKAELDQDTLGNALAQGWPMHRYATGGVFYVEFNHRAKRPTRDYHLRKAMQLVTDPNEIVDKVIKIPGNVPTESLFPSWLQGAHGLFRKAHPPPRWHVDLAAARAELAQARRDLGVAKIPPLDMLAQDDPISDAQAQYFQALYQRTLGLTIKIDKQIFKQQIAKAAAGDFDILLGGWGPDYNDPLTFGNLFTSWNPNNRGHYSNPKLDHWVKVARGSVDQETRMDAFGKIQQILFDDVVIIPYYEQGRVFVLDPRLKGVVRRAIGPDPDYTNAYIDTGAPES